MVELKQLYIKDSFALWFVDCELIGRAVCFLQANWPMSVFSYGRVESVILYSGKMAAAS